MNIGKWIYWAAIAFVIGAHLVLWVSMARNPHVTAKERGAYEEKWGCLYVLLLGIGIVLPLGWGVLSRLF